MDKQKIIDYVIHTPANTNKNVLSTMLDNLITTVINQAGGFDPNEDYIIGGTDLDKTNDNDNFSTDGGEL